MSEIISLSKARKVRARDEDRRRAAENRLKFGRTRAEREVVEKTSERDRRRLDDHRLGDDACAPDRDD